MARVSENVPGVSAVNIDRFEETLAKCISIFL
jgi:hypothetical protein